MIGLSSALLLWLLPWVVHALALLLLRYWPWHQDIPWPAHQGAGVLPGVSILIPAHNEAHCLDEKIRNTLALTYPAQKLEILIASDGSLDATAQIPAHYPGAPMRLFSWSTRRGKAASLNFLIAHARHDLLLLTDASGRLEPEALLRLVEAIAPDHVGIAAAAYKIMRERHLITTHADGETLRWRLDSSIKDALSRRGVLLAAHGAAFLCRRRLLEALPEDTINDDFVMGMRLRSRGFLVRYVPQAHVVDAPTISWQAIYQRLTRIAYGNFQMIWRYRHLWRQRTAFVLQIIGDKAAKTVAGPLAAAGLVGLSGLALVTEGLWWLVLPGWLVVLYVHFLVRDSRPLAPGRWPLWGPALYALVGLAAACTGLIKFCTGAHPAAALWPKKAPAGSMILHLATAAPPPRHLRAAKRLIDAGIAALALLLLWPLGAVLAVAIIADSAGPIFFKQRRIFRHGHQRAEEFTMIKFRTMRRNAEEKSGPVWATPDDQRMTRVGRWLRKSRLDELPQLFSVILGRMSIVGPRPERQFFVQQLQRAIVGYRDRLVYLKPGITGWAQVHCGYDTSVESVRNKVLYDLAYGIHMYRLRDFLRIEASVLRKTLVVIVRGTGAQ